jgi:hypothetical protein
MVWNHKSSKTLLSNIRTVCAISLFAWNSHRIPRGLLRVPRASDGSLPYTSIVPGMTGAPRALDEEAFFEKLQRIQQKMAAARRELEEAQAFARSRQMAWD